MGQCSTLPAGPAGRGAAPSPPGSTGPDVPHQQPPSSRYGDSSNYEQHPQGNAHNNARQPRQRRDDSPTSGMNHSRFARKSQPHSSVADQHMSDAEGAHHTSSENSTTPLRTAAQRYDNTSNMNSFISVARHSNNAFEPFIANEAAPADSSHQTHHPSPPHQPINKVESRNATPTASPKSSAQRRQHHPSNSTTTTAEETNDEDAIALPPESAVRMRCYRLNLEHPFDVHGPNYGPLAYEPPAHHRPRISSSASNVSRRKTNESWSSPPALQMSDSEDSSDSNKSATAVAIATAKIFRGLTIDKNGVITSQNPRASRSNRNKGNKQGEKSRQAAKIDKANDLAEEAVRNGPKQEEGEISNMISLVIVGEYDDMKYLVKDGAKRLREAEALPDEALLGMNRIRQPFQSTPSPGPMGGNHHHPFGGSGRDVLRYGTPNSSRDDVTPAYQHGQFGLRAATPTSPTRKRLSPFPSPSGANNSPYSTPGKPRHRSPQSAPPKLKSHPRDQSRSRRRLVVEEAEVNAPPEAAPATRAAFDDSKAFPPAPTENVEYPSRSRNENPSERAERSSPPRFIPVRDQCHDIFGGDGSDWSEALGLSRGLRSLWDCGATGGNGTMSPTNPSVPSNKNPGSGLGEGGAAPEDEPVYVPEARNESNFVERGGYEQGRSGGALSSGRGFGERGSAADVLQREAPGDRREGTQDVLMAV